MSAYSSRQRAAWFVMGLLVGLGAAYLWPHQPAFADSSDSNDKIVIATCRLEYAGVLEGVFVLDQFTGDLYGAALNVQNGRFQIFYYTNIAADFGLPKDTAGQYSMVSGAASLSATANFRPASGVLYVSEVNTGKLGCFAIPYAEGQQVAGRYPLRLIDVFQFRKAG